jgi:hypothetical protein
MSQGDFYNIDKILDRKKVNGKYLYKIKWEGYPMSQSTWEPTKNLESAIELVEEYNRIHPFPNSQKSSKTENYKFINKKRKEEKLENGDVNKEIISTEKNEEFKAKNNEEESKLVNNENTFERTYTIDDSFKNVVTVKQQNQKLIAVVEKLESNGEMIKAYIQTEELRRSNPWILLNFYESKIKFT